MLISSPVIPSAVPALTALVNTRVNPREHEHYSLVDRFLIALRRRMQKLMAETG